LRSLIGAKVVDRIPPLSTIITEGNLEIGRQVREAVERTVTAGIALDRTALRKWDLSGVEYFAQTLRESILPPVPRRCVPAGRPDAVIMLGVRRARSQRRPLK
jgi:hypothetical protein